MDKVEAMLSPIRDAIFHGELTNKELAFAYGALQSLADLSAGLAGIKSRSNVGLEV
jgi:hypothetical protein